MPVAPLLTIDHALGHVLAAALPLPAETVALEQAHGRVLAQVVLADADVPAFDRAAMDGIAVRVEDGVTARRQIGESAAGSPFPGPLAPGQCVRVMTGGVVPAGADAVVPVEEIDRAGDGTYTLRVPPSREQHIARQGSEVAKGTAVLQPGSRLNGARIGVLATNGCAVAQVLRRAIVAIVPTGNEIVAVTERPVLGQVRDANRHALAGLLAASGAEVRHFPVAKDDRAALTAALATAWEDADVLVTSGGVSAGDYDLVPPVLESLGATAHFHKIAIKPGKPLLFASRHRRGRTQFAFGLPGNPVSSYVCCALFVLPALAALQGEPGDWRRITLPSANALPGTGPRAEVLPAWLVESPGGTQALAQPLGSSADLTRFAAASYLALRSPHSPPLGVGEPLTLLLWPRP